MSTKPGRIFLSPPHMGGSELDFIHDSFQSNYIAPLGPMVDAFEREFAAYTGLPHCVALSSGTAALHLSLHILGVRLADEVIVSTLTFIGGVTPIIFQGAIPVFVDSERSSWNMDPDLLAEELHASEKRGRMPKAVVTTDLYGQCADYGRIRGICEHYGVPLVTDAAEALGARYCQAGSPSVDGAPTFDGVEDSGWVHAGTGSKAAVFSFNGNKIITTSGGGMLASNDRDIIRKARFLSQQARDPAPHYEHSQIGFNYRMSNVVAAIGRGQLQVLQERINRKRQIFSFYKDSLCDLAGIEFMPEPAYSRSTRWLTVVLITPEEFGVDSEAVRIALEAQNIEARPIWKPMHLQPVFKSNLHPVSGKPFNIRTVGGEVGEDLFKRGLCLPSGTAMSDHDLERVVSVIRRQALYQTNAIS
ncbi:MAG TPA: DegT/DnrJ/EryC1/StrS family aminotransferase [Syntrophobacteraceae bacterium]|nr:DegT/DnrJ/EryC1/StrS family aminotransferase [Syntrophobacteraceae bacterium]